MLNPLSFFSKFMKSSNQRELDRMSKIVQKINSLEESVKNLKDTNFPEKTVELKNKIKNGKTLDDILGDTLEYWEDHVSLQTPVKLIGNIRPN